MYVINVLTHPSVTCNIYRAPSKEHLSKGNEQQEAIFSSYRISLKLLTSFATNDIFIKSLFNEPTQLNYFIKSY
ncbi:hypothetical protein GCM10008983_01770 [Lentibacillus halophilus]|uniref:Uncharacterized protein n=1 Tax=Lentibacillus halophilus TaxID=295065 RepID=A0ABN0Z1Q9_9BACI